MTGPNAELVRLEERFQVRLGVAWLDAAGALRTGHRSEERFTMCSTFKAPLAAMIFDAAAGGTLSLDDKLQFTRADLAGHSPVVEKNLAAGTLSIRALAEAAVLQSDNAAANLLLKKTGGPAALTAFFRRLGDSTSRLDRFEPELNASAPGDLRDTTTPLAFAGLLRAMTAVGPLHPAAQNQIAALLVANPTGARRIRAGAPATWRVGDKTGTSGPDPVLVNDVGMLWSPDGTPWFLAVLVASKKATVAEAEAAIAEATRICVEATAG